MKQLIHLIQSPDDLLIVLFKSIDFQWNKIQIIVEGLCIHNSISVFNKKEYEDSNILSLEKYCSKIEYISQKSDLKEKKKDLIKIFLKIYLEFTKHIGIDSEFVQGETYNVRSFEKVLQN